MTLGSWHFNWMARDNENVRVWIDAKVLGRWYVLLWYRGRRPYMYRSDDATPPREDNNGRWIFGRSTGVRC